MSWTQTTLGKVVNLRRGYDLPAAKRIKGSYPVYSSSGVTGFHDKYAVEGPCVITGRYGTLGKVFFSKNACWPLNTALYSREFNGNNPRFIYHLLKTIPWQEYTTASAVPGINRNHVNLCPIRIPDIKTQEIIAAILDSFDNKIATNTKLNGYLEKLVSLEFSRRFKASTPTIELGKVLSISTESIKPQEHAGEIWEHYSIPAYDENRQPLFELSDGIKSNKYAIDANCILISKLNPATKRIWMPSCTSEHSVCSTEFIVYKPKNPRYKSFYYAAIDSQAFTDFLIAHVTGSTGSRQRTQPKATLTYPMPNPGHDAIEGFCAFADPIYKQIQSNKLESKWLVSLRDALLPKLMSGEIDVSKIDLTQLNSHLEKRKAAASVLSLIFPIALPGLWSPMQ